MPDRLRRTSANVDVWGGDLRPVYRRYRALVLLGAAASLLGTYYELLRPQRGKIAILIGDGGELASAKPGPSASAKTVMTVGRRARTLRTMAGTLRRRVARGALDVSWTKIEPLLRREDVGVDAPTGADIVALVVGSDSRAGMTDPKDIRRFGHVEGRRADAIVVARATPLPAQITLLHIPRDLLLDTGTPIGHVLNDGPDALLSAVRGLVRSPIHHYVEVEMFGFRRVVDELGGVDVHLEEELFDRALQFWLPAGRNRLNGQEALNFVRARYVDGSGDLGRIRRQQVLARSVLARALRPSVLANPWRLWQLARAAGSHAVIDQQLDLESILTFARGFQTPSSGAFETATVPTKWSDDGRRLELDQAAAAPMIEAFFAGRATSAFP